MQGGSAVSPVKQAENTLHTWMSSHVDDASGIVAALLQRHLKGSRLLLERLDRPLEALRDYCDHLLQSDARLKDFVREADVEWGRRLDERPHFDREEAPPNPDDPYTVESVRNLLTEMVHDLRQT